MTIDRVDESFLPPQPLPFSLTHLDVYRLASLLFFDRLLQPSITSLSICLRWVEPLHIPSLTTISEQLASLHSITPIGSSRVLEPVFRGCANLSNLAIAATDLGYILPLVPSALDRLTCGGPYLVAGDLTMLLSLLSATPPASVVALSSLRWLRFTFKEKVVTASAAGRDLLEQCEAKGIQVEFEV